MRQVDLFRVEVLGGDGRMGTIGCEAIRQTSMMELIAAVRRSDKREKADPATGIVAFTHPDSVIRAASGSGLSAIDLRS
ncbi:MAG: hypothetical protein ACYCYA_03185 [Actinomycetes bacterium]